MKRCRWEPITAKCQQGFWVYASEPLKAFHQVGCRNAPGAAEFAQQLQNRARSKVVQETGKSLQTKVIVWIV